jgi:hypothetical protein
MMTGLRQAGAAVSLGLVAAGVAALLAHVAIDAVGDVVLVRDAYDGVAHDSRGLTALVLVCGMVAVAARFVLASLSGSAGRDRLRRMLAVPPPAIFIAAVIVATVATVMGMEGLDGILADGDLVSVSQMLGGSVLLGLGMCGAFGALLGWLGWRALRWIAASHETLLLALGALLSVRMAPGRDVAAGSVSNPSRAWRTSSVMLRRAAKRGPPLARFV